METENVETKKCKNCLRRTVLESNKCPHCRSDDFIYDGVFMQWKKPSRVSLLERFTMLFK